MFDVLRNMKFEARVIKLHTEHEECYRTSRWKTVYGVEIRPAHLLDRLAILQFHWRRLWLPNCCNVTATAEQAELWWNSVKSESYIPTRAFGHDPRIEKTIMYTCKL